MMHFDSLYYQMMRKLTCEDFAPAPDPSSFDNTDQLKKDQPNTMDQAPEEIKGQELTNPLKLFLAKLTAAIINVSPEDRRLRNFRYTDFKYLNDRLKGNADSKSIFTILETVIRKIKPFGDDNNSLSTLMKLKSEKISDNLVLKTWANYIFYFIQNNKPSPTGEQRNEQLKVFSEITDENLEQFEAAVRSVVD